MSDSQFDHQAQSDVVGVVLPWFDNEHAVSRSRVGETRGLVEALGATVGFLEDVRVRKKTPSHLLSGGLVERYAEKIDAHGVNLLVVDYALTPIQQRNLERSLQAKVIDRTGLILEIFGLRARSREGVIQVELARLLYERSRLVRTWTHLERQRGGRGFLAGPGESQLEADRRMLDRKLKSLRSDLEAVRRTRQLQRVGRQRSGVPTVALVGYTNAGKSTLFNFLSSADAFAKDMPFATLDPMIRKFRLPSIGEAALVDTVGFITDLPTHLIDSFQATLEEALDADLIVHVRDRSSPVDSEQRDDVLAVLSQLQDSSGRPLPPLIEAWNKCDLLDTDTISALTMAASRAEPAACLVSAETGVGLSELVRRIEAELTTGLETFTYRLRVSDGKARAWLYRHAEILEEQTDGDAHIVLKARIERDRNLQFRKRFMRHQDV